MVAVEEGLSVAVPTEPVCEGDAVADAVAEAHDVADAVSECNAVSTGEGEPDTEGDADTVFDTVVEGVDEDAAEKEGCDDVAVKVDAVEGVAPPLALPFTPPPPMEGDSDMDADSVLVGTPDVEGASKVIEGVVVTLSEGDWVRDKDTEGVAVRVTSGEEDTEGEPAGDAVPRTLTVSVGVGDTEAETRAEPDAEGDPEPVFVAEEEVEAEPVEDAVAGGVAVLSGESEPVLDAELVLAPEVDAVEVVVRV